MHTLILFGKSKKKTYVRDSEMDGKIIFKWMLILQREGFRMNLISTE